MKLCLAVSSLLLMALPVLPKDKANFSGMTDQDFVTRAAQRSMTEVHLGKLAQQKGASESVKQFGEKLVNDRTDAYQRLSTIAQNKNMVIPQGISSEHQKVIDKLDKLSGQQFDKQFQQMQVKDYKKDIAMFRWEAEHGTDPDLKAYASQMIPVLENHLQIAQTLPSGSTQRTVGQ